ncbi:MAG: hypothetical protein U0V64_15030 [Cyclobacteriaceae bacterium]
MRKFVDESWRKWKITALSMLLLLSTHAGFGQVINSVSPDKTGMYYYSVDSMLGILLAEHKLEKVVLRANWSIIANFPDEIRGMRIQKDDRFKALDMKKISAGDVLIQLGEVEIIKSQFTIGLSAFYKAGRSQLHPYGHGLYQFQFRYDADHDSYTLRRVKIGLPVH